MPIKLPSDLDVLASPTSTDILIAQRLPEQVAKQLTIADILALVSTSVPDGSITTAKLASGACTNMNYAGISAGKALQSYFDNIIDVAITLQAAYSYVIVVAFFTGYGQRNSGTGDYGAEIELSRVGGSVITTGFAGFASGGYSSAAVKVGSSAMLMGIHWTGASPGTVTFRLRAKYVYGSASGYCTGGTIFAFEMKR